MFTNTHVKTHHVQLILSINPSNRNKTLVTFSKKMKKKRRMKKMTRTRVQRMKKKMMKSWMVKIHHVL